MNKIFTFCVLLLFYMNLNSQNLDFFLADFKKVTEKNFFEKIYLHTDKKIYCPKEKIWFTGYLYNSKKGRLDSGKQIIFVEFITPSKKILMRKNIMSKNGKASCFFSIPDSVYGGLYQLRAYSNSMKNFSSKFFFTKLIKISTKQNTYSYIYYKNAKKIKRKRRKIFVDYKISNEKLINGLNCKISFISSNNQGNYLNTIAYITDNKRNIVSKKNNNFYGELEFIPEYNKKYYLVLNAKKHSKEKIKLPEVKEKGTILEVNERRYKLEVQIKSNINQSNSFFNKKNLLIGHKNGNIFFKKQQKNNDKINIYKDSLPYGITEFVLINNEGKILSKYLHYKEEPANKHNINCSFRNDTIIIDFTEIKNESLNISLSISNDTSNNKGIKKYINYYSDLSNNEHYSNEKDKKLLKITLQIFGKKDIWRKKENYFPLKGISISGRVSCIIEKNPAKNSKVRLTILNKSFDYYKTTADEKGEFSFDNLNYKDSIKFLVEAKTRKGKNFTVIDIDGYDTAKIFFNPYFNTNLKQIKYKKIDKRKRKKRKNGNNAIYGRPDQTLYQEDFANKGYNSVLEVLQGRVPGFQRTGNTSILRGFSSITQSSEPLYLLDNVPVSSGLIESLNLQDIERIEIVKSSSKSAIYGERGGNGIISVYTKKGHNIDWGKTESKTIGISENQKFKYFNSNFTYKTFYWNPEIKINKKNKKIKIPLNKKSKYYVINIQGISRNGKTIYYKKVLKNIF